MTIDKENMMIAFQVMGKKALAMNHYELEAASDATFDSKQWKEFLSLPEVKEYIKKEMEIIRDSQVNKIIQESGDSRSVGQAQILNALQKTDESSNKKEGPIFVYCYVPLNEEQKHATNILEVDENGKPKT